MGNACSPWSQVTLLAAQITSHLAPLVVQPYVVGEALLPHIMDTLKRARGTDSPVVRALGLALRVLPASCCLSQPLCNLVCMSWALALAILGRWLCTLEYIFLAYA